MKKGIEVFFVKEDITVREAMRKISLLGERMLVVVDADRKLKGSLTEGDIRRWILRKGNIRSKIKSFYNKRPKFVREDYDLKEVKKMMLKKKMAGLPVIDKNRKVVDILLWSKVFGRSKESQFKKIDIPIVIMAGGKGTRLDPFTKVLPKPLVPIGDKTVIEIIMDKFRRHGVNDFIISVNHKSRMIDAFFAESKAPYHIKYLREQKPLGTAGSLKMLPGKGKGSILVSNCDIIIDHDYHEIVKYHKVKSNDITIVASLKHFKIPYGVCLISHGGNLVNFREKPEYNLLVNTGMYLIKKSVLKYIPKDKPYDFTELLQEVKKNNGKIGVFPVDEKSWIDVGQWEEYHKALRMFGV